MSVAESNFARVLGVYRLVHLAGLANSLKLVFFIRVYSCPFVVELNCYGLAAREEEAG